MTYTGATQIISLTAGFVMGKKNPLSFAKAVAALVKKKTRGMPPSLLSPTDMEEIHKGIDNHLDTVLERPSTVAHNNRLTRKKEHN